MSALPQPASSLPVHSSASPEQAAQVLRQFRVVFNAVRSHFQQVEKRVGIGGAQVWALNVIQNQPGVSVNELARAMDIHQSTASNLIRQLVKRELVRTEKSAADRRGVQLFIEAAGQLLLQGAPGPYEGVLPEALQQLPPATLDQLQLSLAQLIQALKADEQAGGIPLAEL
ncbi:MarR family winged helix-turn-helix transcriptional regulator [Malikia spinosa]|uniref:MarR family winged helix-turn-helix transcriptional regulator n=1 Tax=Malikia spinosa TaxID=86180 RepID=UPI003FA1CA32